jgi:acetoacetate decarboxylase
VKVKCTRRDGRVAVVKVMDEATLKADWIDPDLVDLIDWTDADVATLTVFDVGTAQVDLVWK